LGLKHVADVAASGEAVGKDGWIVVAPAADRANGA